jgi:WD40 repeat protein
MASKTHLAELPHNRVVNSAYFSPITGNKILTTCQDNRIRIWDCLYGNLEEASREVVHSHDFNRYLTAFRAEWDPKVCLFDLSLLSVPVSAFTLVLSCSGSVEVSHFARMESAEY